MNKIKVLCLLFLINMTILFVACSEAGKTGFDETSTASVTAADTNAETEETCDLPDDLDFEGKLFTIIACDEDVPYTYIETTEQNGDVINDAVYMRNLSAENQLNIKLEVVNIKGIDTETPVKKSILAGDKAYDLISPHILQSISALVTQNLLQEFNDVPYIDLNKSWWNQIFAETMSIKGKIFYASGDIIVPNARVIVFNKQMMADYNKEDIYEVVLSGRWTIDKLGEYVKDMVIDKNSDGIYDKNDQYAFSDLGNTGLATSFVHASDMLFLEVSGDSFRLTLTDEKMNVIINKLYDYLYRDGNNKITNEDFGNGNVFFGSQVLLKLQILRSYDTDFGIIPFPKYDEVQSKYYSSVWNGLLCIPVDVKDIDYTGAVLESMAYYSSKTLIPAYYEKLLDSKFVRDEESTEMLDIIFSGLIYDFGLCFDNFMGNYSSVGTLLNQGSVDLASFIAKNENKFTQYYQSIFDSVNVD